MEEISTKVPTIPEFFAGRTIFITGVTGFMGKILLEKLLRSCPDITKIYVLLRPKKGRTVEERLDELKKDPVYERLCNERPGVFDGPQLSAIAGDVGLPRLGISTEDREMLCKEVSIVFHSAATVRFDEPIRRAVELNTKATFEMIKMAEQMKNLLAFLYVSTTYCNTNRNEIDEAVYPAGISWRSMLRMLEHFDDDILNILTPKLLRKLPNTYSFSKGLSEDLIYDHRHTVPAIIFRPSVVCSTMSEPVPGWIDNLNGPAGLLIACGKGIVHSSLCHRNKIMDFSPVDVAIKGMISAVWKNGVERSGIKFPPEICEAAKVEEKDDGRRPNPPPVYNCATSSIRPITIGFVAKLASTLAPEVALNDALWVPTALLTTNRLLHYSVVFLMQILPAIVVDSVRHLCGIKPRLLKIQRRIMYASYSLEYYLQNEWIFHNKRFFNLEKYMTQDDLKNFGSEVWDGNEYEYFRDCMFGARKYLLHEPEDTLEGAKRHFQRLYYLDRTLRCILLSAIIYFICSYLGLLNMSDGQTSLQAV